MSSSIPPLERQLLPFVALQGAFSTLAGFGALLVYTQGGMAASVQYTACMLGIAMLSIMSPFVLGRALKLRGKRLVRLSFGVPAVALWWADGHPLLLALSFGGFLGWSWAARHWLELSTLKDAERDAYATHVTVVWVVASLVSTAVVATLLSLTNESPMAVYGSYAVLAAVASVWAARSLPNTPVMQWERPLAVVRQPGFKACLPLYFLESGMLGIGMVLGAGGASQALGQVSHYGWVSVVATVVGAAALFALRRKRHSGNRVRWMGLACIGMASGQLLLGASVLHPALYVLHLLLIACVQPFWQASEQVLNQRAMDLHGALADRIVVRETVLGLSRLLALGLFWLLIREWDAVTVLLAGTTLMATAAVLEWALGRALLRRAA
jgi:hypothetical protein